MIRSFTSILKIASFILLLGILPVQSLNSQEITGLSDWTLFIDPGHSQTENMGLFGYSEAEKVLRVAWALRDMFEEQTDIETVYMARLTDQDLIGLTERIDLANSLGADFYYSIHSDAGPSHVNSTLMLYGGWKSNGVLVEKTPEGGGAFGAILDFDLTSAMRIDRRGNFADRVFYQGDVFHHTNQFPFLAVNRLSTMASLLSEAGFHTNPGQQMLNLNNEWKTLEALSAFRSFLEWHDIDRPVIGVATGIIRDIETNLALNDVTVTIGDQVYVTDGWESLFNQYSLNPEQLRNGFYFLQDMEPLTTVEVVFEKENYQSLTLDLDIVSNPNGLTGENLSFLDPFMVSLIPPKVVQVTPHEEQLQNLVPGTPLVVHFSRKMDKPTVESSFSIIPDAAVDFSWNNDFVLTIHTSELEYLQSYTITLDGAVAKNLITGQFLDGNGDGEEGGNFVLEITMSDEDIDPPAIVQQFPVLHQVPGEKRPVIRFVYDEEIIEESISGNPVSISGMFTDHEVNGTIHHIVIDDRSILHFFPTEDLSPWEPVIITIHGGLSDVFGNTTEAVSLPFMISDHADLNKTTIDNFNAGVASWWHPDQAGQTEGIIPGITSRTANGNVVVHSEASSGSMKLSYGWDMDFAGMPYIRQYLPPTSPQNSNRFNIQDILRVYVFGDGSNNEFRMVIRDGLNQLEAQNWITIDWTGWKLISWDLANDPVNGWVNGNGILEGSNFYVDGFHLRYAQGANTQGAIYFDHLHFVRRDEIVYREQTSFIENFDAQAPFATNIFPWITLDQDSLPTTAPVDFSFPGAGDPFAFKVLDPLMTTPPIVDDFPPVTGFNYLMAVKSQAAVENKWLISPQFRATEVTDLSFFARSLPTGSTMPEEIKVFISQDDGEIFFFDPANFTQISDGALQVPDFWTYFSFYLGDYNGEVFRFAVQYVSENGNILMLDDFQLDALPAFSLQLIAQPEDGGQLSGEGSFIQGAQVALEASPNVGFRFDRWTDTDGELISEDASHVFTMPAESTTLKGVFEPLSFNLTLHVAPEGSGTAEGADTYFFQQEVTVSAIPADENLFINWTDRDLNVVSTDQTYTFTMPSRNHELTANFEIVGFAGQAAENDLHIYPNPARDRVMVRHTSPVKKIIVSDLGGRQLLQWNFTENENEIEVSSLKTGIYLLRIETENSIIHHKIQINQ